MILASPANPPACLSTTWLPVADRVRDGQWDRWAWRLTWAERELLTAALEAGTATTAQRREAGKFVLVARVVGRSAK